MLDHYILNEGMISRFKFDLSSAQNALLVFCERRDILVIVDDLLCRLFIPPLVLSARPRPFASDTVNGTAFVNQTLREYYEGCVSLMKHQLHALHTKDPDILYCHEVIENGKSPEAGCHWHSELGPARNRSHHLRASPHYVLHPELLPVDNKNRTDVSRSAYVLNDCVWCTCYHRDRSENLRAVLEDKPSRQIVGYFSLDMADLTRRKAQIPNLQ
ncbi:hypothetical protein Tco_0003230 [Tanacetum coccineum]